MIIRNSLKQPIQINRYKVLKQIAKGGFGTVYHVEYAEKEYALKLLHNYLNIQRIKSQLEVLKILNTSPLFLKTYQSKREGNFFFLVFELSLEQNLNKLVKQKLFLETEAITVLLELLEALKFLQKHNIIHGDIKAENILKKEDRFYLIDFDVIKRDQEVKTLHILNDDDFTAPEIYRGIQTTASDIYSLGCTLYYMLSAKHIYHFNDSTNFSQKMFAHLYAKPCEDKNITPKMYHLIKRMIDKDYTTRASINEIQEILKDER
jgi:serine/threonine protein kinase